MMNGYVKSRIVLEKVQGLSNALCLLNPGSFVEMLAVAVFLLFAPPAPAEPVIRPQGAMEHPQPG